MIYICEICGRKTNKIYTIVIDGAILRVCEDCRKFGKEVAISYGRVQEKQPPKKQITGYEEEITDNYNILLRNAREQKGLSQKAAAKLLGIKESTYKAIEDGKIKPTIELARKIEKEFGIRIIQKVALFEESTTKGNKLTVADVIEFEED